MSSSRTCFLDAGKVALSCYLAAMSIAEKQHLGKRSRKVFSGWAEDVWHLHG